MSPIRYLLPKGSRPRRFYEANRHTIGYLFLVAYVTAVLGFALDDSRDQGDDIRDAGRAAFRQIEESRIEQTRASCVRTNRKVLSVLRGMVEQQLTDVERVPEPELRRLGFTRAELAARARERLRRVQPTDCAALVRRLRQTSPDVGAG